MEPAAPAYYESDRMVAEYLLFHYGTAADLLPSFAGAASPAGVLEFPARCVTETFDHLAPGGRALDLGCAVGRAAFEFTRLGLDAVGLDYSRAFIAAAERLRAQGVILAKRKCEGEIGTDFAARVPEGADPARVRFLQGDAMEPPPDLGVFDAVLMANLIDRLYDPAKCLRHLPGLVKPGGQLVITSPYTWLDEFTPREKWLGGVFKGGVPVRTLDGLRAALEPVFSLVRVLNLPFIIREHDRKFQWSIAEASVWRRSGSGC